VLAGADLVALGDIDAIGAILVDDRHTQLPGFLAEFLLGVVGDEIGRGAAVELAADLRPWTCLPSCHQRLDWFVRPKHRGHGMPCQATPANISTIASEVKLLDD